MPTLDRWLRFDAHTEHRYEIEYGADRVAELRHTIILGIIVYNIYIATGMLLMPDLTYQVIVLRLLMISPFSLFIAYMLTRVSSGVRELMLTLGMLAAHLVPTYLFLATTSPLGHYTFGESTLSLVFGNMLLALRFRHAVLFTAGIFLLNLAALLAKPDLPDILELSFLIQTATACAFTLYANYLQESRRCRDYIHSVNATIRAELAESSKRALTEMSRTDALTGLPNRRHLDERLDEWLAETNDIAVMMVDIDHFKLFNDTLGHPEGDRCLRQIASVLDRIADNPGIFCARFGGEEFTVIARDMPASDATRLAQHIVTAIAGLRIHHPGRQDRVEIVTTSIGVSLKSGDEDKTELVAMADAALYQAKRLGRNRFILAHPETAPRALGL